MNASINSKYKTHQHIMTGSSNYIVASIDPGIM